MKNGIKCKPCSVDGTETGCRDRCRKQDQIRQDHNGSVAELVKI